MNAPPGIAALLDSGVRDGVFPSAALLVGTPENILIDCVVGDCTPATLFDLASLTKPLCTAVRCAQLVANGRLAYEAALADLWPHAAASPYARATLRELLEHTSGAPPGLVPLYAQLPADLRNTARARAWMVDAALQTLPVTPTGAAYHYSDIGYLILGGLLEAIDGRALDVQWHAEIAAPPGCDAIRFRVDTLHCAPTGFCAWRGRELCGEVHDPNAAACGGVAPHAGLFGRVRDLHQFSRALYAVYAADTPTVPTQPRAAVGSATPAQTTAPAWLTSHALHTALAFDTPRRAANTAHRGGFAIKSRDGYSSMGTWGTPHTIGHLGFTGCSWWIDLDHATWIILLTNRVALGSDTAKIMAFRPQLHSAIGVWLQQRT